MPSLAHGQKGGVRYSLRVGRDAVVFLGRQINIFGPETAQNGFDFAQSLVRRAMLNENERLSERVHTRAMQ